jgi:hypothetical protein
VEAGLPKDTQPQKEQIKVTDKRIFTPDGDIREEFRDVIKPATETAPAPKTETAKPQAPVEKPEQKVQEQKPLDASAGADRRAGGDRRRSLADRASGPGTPFTSFLEPLVAQAYMSLGMLSNPYQPQARPDPAAARQMIDILTLLKEKTKGNLTPDEEEFFETYLGELKLAFVKVTKSI